MNQGKKEGARSFGANGDGNLNLWDWDHQEIKYVYIEKTTKDFDEFNWKVNVIWYEHLSLNIATWRSLATLKMLRWE